MVTFEFDIDGGISEFSLTEHLLLTISYTYPMLQ